MASNLELSSRTCLWHILLVHSASLTARQVIFMTRVLDAGSVPLTRAMNARNNRRSDTARHPLDRDKGSSQEKTYR